MQYKPKSVSSTKPRCNNCSRKNVSNERQYVPPGASSITIGCKSLLPVWISGNSSKVSSSVPNPPGSNTNPSDSLMNISLRVKKYLKLMSLGSSSITGLGLAYA